MNDFDRDNLEWFLGASDEERLAWAEDMGVEHLRYMARLIKIAKSELFCDMLDCVEEELDPELKQARKVLTRIAKK